MNVYPSQYQLPELTAHVVSLLERRRQAFDAWDEKTEGALRADAEAALDEAGKQFRARRRRGCPATEPALALVDLRTTQRMMSSLNTRECAAWGRWKDALGEAWYLHSSVCAMQLSQPEPNGGPTRVDFSTAPALVTTALRGLLSAKVEMPEPESLLAELEKHLAAERTPLGRSVLAAAASCLAAPSNAARAHELALVSVEAQPRSSEGFPCEPWFQVVYVSQLSQSSLHGVRAWYPWHAEAWTLNAHAAPERLAWTRRAYLFAPARWAVVSEFIESLLASGLRTDARAILASLDTSDALTQLRRDGYLVAVDASEARFEHAFALALEQSVPRPDEPGRTTDTRYGILIDALPLAHILGKTGAWADSMWEQFFSKTLPRDVLNNPRVDLHFGMACLYATKERAACFAALDRMYAERRFPNQLAGAPRLRCGTQTARRRRRRRGGDEMAPAGPHQRAGVRPPPRRGVVHVRPRRDARGRLTPGRGPALDRPLQRRHADDGARGPTRREGGRRPAGARPGEEGHRGLVGGRHGRPRGRRDACAGDAPPAVERVERGAGPMTDG